MVSYHWKIKGEPIAALEGHSRLLVLRRRLQSVKSLEKREMHLSDSQTCVWALVKHRSRASSKNFLCKTALELAGVCRVSLASCRLHRNPADEPSRRPKSPRKHGTKKGAPSLGAAVN